MRSFPFRHLLIAYGAGALTFGLIFAFAGLLINLRYMQAAGLIIAALAIVALAVGGVAMLVHRKRNSSGEA